MSEKAYVLIETAVGKSLETMAALRRCEWVESVERMAGAYDVMVIATGSTLPEIEQAVRNAITLMDGVTRSVVCLVRGDAAA